MAGRGMDIVRTRSPAESLAARLHDRAIAAKGRGHLVRAAAFARASVAVLERHAGDRRADLADALNTLGAILVEQGQYALAEACHGRASHLVTRASGRRGGEPPRAVRVKVQSLRHLANVLRIR